MDVTSSAEHRRALDLVQGIHAGITKLKSGAPLTLSPGTSTFAQFLERCPDHVRDHFSAHPELAAQVEQLVAQDPEAQPGEAGLLGRSGVWCTACHIGGWAGIVLVLAGIIVVSQGALVAPVIAAQSGIPFTTLFAAIFGISDAAMATILGGAAAAGLTFGALVDAGCKASGCC